MMGQDKHKAKEVIRGGSEWIANHNKVVEAGGLHILGTERHEARRIDNQLRGRSGRQGDPGSSRFYLSLEDDLMRIFASERISAVMQRLGMTEGQEIESKMVSKAIENAQKRVEGRNFEIRKHLLEYDDVMNSQREYIYSERNEILEGEDISYKIDNYIKEICESGADIYSDGNKNPGDWDIDGMKLWLKSKYAVDIEDIITGNVGRDEFVEKLYGKMKNQYGGKENEIGPENMRALERMITLQVIDSKWREHLLAMDELRDGIWTVGYGERNPLVEYKLRGFRIFNEMLDGLNESIVEYLMKVQVREEVREEEQNFEFRPVGQEYHAEVGQFGAGGIPLYDSDTGNTGRPKGPSKESSIPVTGGVKKKKTRRSRRG
jgi:preprotein translocase subunit SecA